MLSKRAWKSVFDVGVYLPPIASGTPYGIDGSRSNRKIIMRVRPTTIGIGILIVASFGLLTACSQASFADRMAYLGKVANEGVQTHRLIVSEGGTTDVKRCTDAFNGLNNRDSAPSDDGMGGWTPDWLAQIQAFFVQSCVTGLPKPVPSQATDGPSGPSGQTVQVSASSTP
jgi:hypothetical protein